ncbi:MAG: DHH family phosphoesterase [Candidatus Poseidoniaceae archaeon]
MRWYAYNGDADGICSMVQWGLVYGIEGHRVTGVKRDIELLERVNPNPDDEIIVMDISLARNHARAVELSSQGFDITWFDHHLAGEPIDAIATNIDTSANICTARIVEKFLGVESDWAQVALHGDGLSVHSSKPEFKELGELLNYNGYGADLSDLHFHPDELLLLCLQAKTPQNFMDTQAFMTLKNGFESDLLNAKNIELSNGYYLLPNESWARRVVGVMAHRINESGNGPHVIAIDKGESLQVSIRGTEGIGDLCKMFGGGGRATAGGIDALPKDDITALMNEVNSRRSA